MKIKFKKLIFLIFSGIFLFVVLFVFGVAYVMALNTYDTGYRINTGAGPQNILIDSSGTCKKITNTSGKDIFVPTKTAAEWNAFNANKPANVAIEACWSCGSAITDPRDSTSYSTILIGTQCWMAKNLNYGTYVTVATTQAGAGTQKYCYADNTASCTTYGGLYEWAEMMSGAASCNGTGSSQPACTTPVQGICPSGWHIPSHYEWTLLEKNVGANPSAFPYDITTTGWLGTDEGGNLKETGTTRWLTPNTGATNTSSFTALPGGYSWIGSFAYVGYFGNWWSATESGANAWSHNLHYTEARVYRGTNDKAYGFSVRCVKD